jgi:hypothetical protein
MIPANNSKPLATGKAPILMRPSGGAKRGVLTKQTKGQLVPVRGTRPTAPTFFNHLRRGVLHKPSHAIPVVGSAQLGTFQGNHNSGRFGTPVIKSPIGIAINDHDRSITTNLLQHRNDGPTPVVNQIREDINNPNQSAILHPLAVGRMFNDQLPPDAMRQDNPYKGDFTFRNLSVRPLATAFRQDADAANYASRGIQNLLDINSAVPEPNAVTTARMTNNMGGLGAAYVGSSNHGNWLLIAIVVVIAIMLFKK